MIGAAEIKMFSIHIYFFLSSEEAFHAFEENPVWP